MIEDFRLPLSLEEIARGKESWRQLYQLFDDLNRFGPEGLQVIDPASLLPNPPSR